MDDLRMIRETLTAEPPSARATVQARNRLTAAIATPRPARGRWSRRLALGGAATLAGAVALALLVGSPAHRTTPTPTPTARNPVDLSARGILLAAATQAASEGETGRYWHVQTVGVFGPYQVGTAPHRYDIVDRTVEERWIARDPAQASWNGRRDLGFSPRDDADRQAWREAGSPKYWDQAADTTTGTIRRSMTPGKGELIRLDSSTYLEDLGGFDRDQVDRLPSDPAKLRALFVARIAAREGGFPAGSDGSYSVLYGAMCQLLLDVPAPPAVRAAAFTVLAGIPGMRSTGTTKDDEGRTGIGIELAHTYTGLKDTRQLIVDPTTHLILASNYVAYLTGKGKTRPIKEGHAVILKAEWTDEQPKAPTIS